MNIFRKREIRSIEVFPKVWRNPAHLSVGFDDVEGLTKEFEEDAPSYVKEYFVNVKTARSLSESLTDTLNRTYRKKNITPKNLIDVKYSMAGSSEDIYSQVLVTYWVYV